MPRPQGLTPPKGPKDHDKFQRAAAKITNNPKFAEVLKDLDNNAQARSEAANDAKGYFKKKGIEIPDEADVEFVEGSIYVRICCWGYCLVFYNS
jgi:hypothetical protein